MKQNSNSRRMAELAREKLGYILLFEVSDPDLDLVTLTGCEVSLDKSILRAYVSCEESRYDDVRAALARAKGRIRSLLGHALGWRVTPDIVFEIDTTTGKKNIVQVANNVTTRINEYLDPDSSFFQLGAGINTIGYNAASGSDYLNVRIEYKMRFLGV